MPIQSLEAFGLACIILLCTLTDYILKKKMIDKGFVNDDTQAIFKQHQSVEG